MRLGQSRWFAYAFCGALLAACGGGGGDNGGSSKTFSTPEDGAALAAAMTNIITKVGGAVPSGGTGGKSLYRPSRAKADVPGACDSGSEDFTPNETTTYGFDGTTIFADCTQNLGDSQNTQLISDGRLVDTCTDASPQDPSNCSSEDLEFGSGSTPLTLETKNNVPIDIVIALLGSISTDFNDTTGASTIVIDSLLDVTDNAGTHVTGNFDNFTVSDTPNATGGTDTVTLDGGVDVDDHGASNCGSGSITIDTLTPLTVASGQAAPDFGSITAGKLKLTSNEDGSIAEVQFNSNGTQTVTVNGESQNFTAAQVAALCN